MSQNYPVVLCFSGHDPSGGAGIQADIETLASHHCHCTSVITALTEQDSKNVKNLLPQKAEDIMRQAQTVLEDMDVSVIKIGLLGHEETVFAICKLLQYYPDIPVVLDPILSAGGGASLSNDAVMNAINKYLLPHISVLTPNINEARLLTGLENVEQCGLRLLKSGCDYVLITGADEIEDNEKVKNYLFGKHKLLESYYWERLPECYHGSGCTLSSSIAGLMAQGLAPFLAITEAQHYAWYALKAGYKVGKGQLMPKRLFWLEKD